MPIGEPAWSTPPLFNYQSFNLIAFNKGDYSAGPLLDRSLEYIVEQGANLVLLDWVVAFNDDGSIVPQVNSTSHEPTRSDILKLAKRIHEAGLKVFFKPHISFPDSFENRMHYNTDLTRFSMSRFFDDWSDYIVTLGMDAATAGIEGVVIATEFTGFDANDCGRWSQLIAKLRAVYAGAIGYDALFNVQSQLANVDRVCFWGEMDIIGISLYVPLSKNDRASLTELNAAWRANPFGDIVDVIDYLRGLSIRYGKPVMAMESGYQSAVGGLFDVGAIGTPRQSDNAVQVLGLTSMLETLGANRGSWFAGISIWSVFPAYFDPVNQASGPWYAQGYMPNGKPGTEVIRQYFTGNGQYVPVIEYYNATLDHYFITWVRDEIAKLDAGTDIAGWKRTGRSFKTYVPAQAGTSAVCRFYIPPALGDSHFFGRGTTECDATGEKNPSFVRESSDFMQIFLPSAGICPANTAQVYRVFSNRTDANHRYMTDKEIRGQMVAKGWLIEGDGPDAVVMCAPS